MKILHIHRTNTNLGDLATGEGVKKMLLTRFPKAEIITKEVFDEFTIDDLEEVNDSFDMIVVGGGGLLKNYDFDSGWMWNIKQDLLKKIKKNIYLYGIGLNVNVKGNAGKLSSINEAKIKEVLQMNNVYLGARDEWTYNWGKKVGCRNLFFVPCPSMFVEEVEYPDKIKSISSKIVGINLVPENYILDPELFENELKFILEYITSKGYVAKIITHNSDKPIDYEKEIANKLSLDIVLSTTPREALYNYRQLKFSIVSRAHPIIFSLCQYTPTIPIIYNYKSREFANLFEENKLVYFPKGFINERMHTFSKNIKKYIDQIDNMDINSFNKKIEKKLLLYKSMNNNFVKIMK